MKLVCDRGNTPMRPRIFIPIVCLLTTLQATAQDDEHLEADRPSESQSAQTVDRHAFQIELGLRREVADPETVDYFEPRTVLRYGLLEGFELRAEVQPLTERHRDGGRTETGLRPIELGFKAGLWKGKGLLPEAALYTQVGIPKFASEAFRPTYAEPRIRLLLENEINQQWRLNYNIGAEWSGEDTKPQWLYTLSPEVTLGKHWEAFAEVYGFVQGGALPEHSVDAGLSYFIGKKGKVDLSTGAGLTSAAPVNFVALGFSVKL
ncbi:transporter [Flaviaesturariibacter aridisoli]|uniref:Transporter n=2 Tax=Flaviaesturariibacter aridisoli TaxID=2545761 RepID=A0A4R4E110_9BACT|nr:transporter [Flaviaesturariibacter aridisoli]